MNMFSLRNKIKVYFNYPLDVHGYTFKGSNSSVFVVTVFASRSKVGVKGQTI